jgi:DNA-binding IclR family transcriptional regulator
MALANDDRSSRRVKSVENAIRIISLLEEREGARVIELADTLDLTKGTVHTQLATLEEYGLVSKYGDTYHLGLRFLELGENAKNRLDIIDVAEPELDKLAEETDTRTQLVVEENGLAVCVHLSRGPNAILPPTDVGYREYLHCIASGKALMAHLPDERVEMAIERHGLPARTSNTISDRDDFYEELEQIRERGYAINDEEKLTGLRALGTPLIGPDESVMGAISISDTTQNMQEDRFHEKLPNRLRQTANRIEVNFNARYG